MNYRMMGHLLMKTLQIVACFMTPALIISLVQGDYDCALGFAASMAVMIIPGLMPVFKRPRNTTFHAREGFVLVAVTWTLVSITGALPFYISGAIPSFIDCVFETVSGFTTTGASILSDVEALPDSMLYWRSFSHWLGGMGVLVFLLAISSFSTGSGDSIFIMRAESPGPQVSKLVPRTRGTAKILYAIYIGITVLQFVMLVIGKMPVFDALLITFGTVGTGGFGVKNDSIMSYSPYIQWVIIVFMAMCGTNFGIYYLMLKRDFRRVLRDEEFRMYVITLTVASVIIGCNVFRIFDGDFSETFRHSVFQVVSIMTSTGFASVDYEIWPQLCHVVLLVLMLIGASAGSTGGGIKCSRIIMLFRSMRGEMTKMLHPNVIKPVKIDGMTVPKDTVSGVYSFMAAYAVVAIVSVMLVSIDGYSFETNVSSVLACLSNIGPGFNLTGATGNYGAFSPFVKVVLSLVMLIGRLEIFPMLLIFLPGVWTKARH